MKLEELIDIAMEVESEDPIDWGYLNIDEKESYKLIGLSVLEMYKEWKNNPDKDKIMLSTITKLIVENFVLNLHLRAERRNNA